MEVLQMRTVGLQLYTLRNETKEDFVGTLKKVAALGYKAVEFAGYGDIPAQEMKKILDDLGLEAPSSHVGLDILENRLDAQIEYSLAISSKYVILPWIPTEKIMGQERKQLADTLSRVADELRKHGLVLGYHNHDFEFKQEEGQYLLDLLYRAVPAESLVAELDLYWVTKAGLDAKDYLAQYKGRCPIIHVKDMTKDERRYFAEVGYGSIDYPSIFTVAQDAGVEYYIVEQDQCERPPLESVKMSIEYLRSIGIA
jgi:sugar phosphate isomerase/epimerase